MALALVDHMELAAVVDALLEDMAGLVFQASAHDALPIFHNGEALMRRPIKDVTQWHRWFAWYPVIVNGHRVWWEWVEARGTFLGYCLGDECWKWEYR